MMFLFIYLFSTSLPDSVPVYNSSPLYYVENRQYYYYDYPKWQGPLSYDELIQNNILEETRLWHEGLCPRHLEPLGCANHGFSFRLLMNEHDSLIALNVKPEPTLIENILECRNCFAFNKISSYEIKCLVVFFTVIVLVILLVIWIAKYYKKENAIMVVVIIGFITNLLTALIQNNIYYFSKDTVRQLEQHDTLLNRMKDLLYRTYDVQNNVKENVATTKRIEKFLMQSYTASDIRVNKQLKIDTNIVVEIDVLEDKFRWKCQSTTTITYGPKKKDLDQGIWKIVESYTKSQISGAIGFICIGSASAEGDYAEEEDRSAKRMQQLCKAFKEILPPQNGVPVYGLSLGKFIEEGKPIGCSDKRIDQRRIVVLKIIHQRENITFQELSQAVIKVLLQKATNKNSKFPIDIRNYSRYQKGVLSLQKSC